MKKFQLWLSIFICVFSVFFANDALAAEPYMSINLGDGLTKSRYVTLWFSPNFRAQYVRISDFSDINFGQWQPYFSQKAWLLPPGSGTKTVWVQFRDQYGLLSSVVSDSIVLTLPATTTLDFSINNNATKTTSRSVELRLFPSEGIDTISVGNTRDTLQAPVRIQNTFQWALSPGTGEKTVFIQYTDGYGVSKIVSKKIHYTEPARYLKEGSVLKGQGDTVYYHGHDGKLHPFLHSAIYHSWFKDFSNITVVSQGKIREYQIGDPVCMRPGTWLIRFSNSPRVYAVEPSCMLRPIRSESEAYILYGKEWQKRVVVLDAFYEIFYRVKSLTNYPLSEDRDRDGIDFKQEQSYGSSDSKVDTDNDGLSDYEEIIYWFSDPTLDDTDADGAYDGAEILRNQSPVGFGVLTKVPEGTYEYPIGSVVADPAKKSSYVYRDEAGLFHTYTIAKTTSKTTDQKKINFAENFIIRPTIVVPVTKSKSAKSTEPLFLQYPVTQGAAGYIVQ